MGFIQDAAQDNNKYARWNGAWSIVTDFVDCPNDNEEYVRKYGQWVQSDGQYLRVDGTNMMLGDIHANGHNVDNVTQLTNVIGVSNYSITLGPSIDIASDS